MNECVLVADLQARHPPRLHVGMVAVRDVDRAPAAERAFVVVAEILQTVQVVQVPFDRAMLAIDLQREQRLVAARKTRRLEAGERAVGEACQEQAGILGRDGFAACRSARACARG